MQHKRTVDGADEREVRESVCADRATVEAERTIAVRVGVAGPQPTLVGFASLDVGEESLDCSIIHWANLPVGHASGGAHRAEATCLPSLCR